MKHVFIKSIFGPIRLDFDGDSLLRVMQVSRKGVSDTIEASVMDLESR